MEQLKVRKKDTIIRNSIFYLMLSFLFLYLQYAYRHQLSPFSMTYMRKSIELFWYAAVPLIVTGFMIWFHHRYSMWAYRLCGYLITYKVIEGLFIEFNKIIVVALFFYTVISYFIYQLLIQYFTLARINPNYLDSDLFGPLLRKIPCQLNWGDKSFSGFLTNWDETGCFIYLDEAIKPPGNVVLAVDFHGRKFQQNGEVVAHSVDFHGVGVKLEQTGKDLKTFNWSEFIELIQELGFQPKRLR
jgi:hypothetical protein